MAYKYKYDERELKALEKRALKGDNQALTDLRSELRRLSKAANSRLLRIEKAGFENQSQAYARSIGYLNAMQDSNRFRVSKSMEVEDLVQNYREVRLFLNKESSTITGIKAGQDRLFKTLKSFNIDIAEENKSKFYEFIGSVEIQDAIDYIGEYDVVMDAIANNLDKIGGDLTKLKKQFNQFLAGDIFYDELLEKIGGMSLEELYRRHRGRRTRRNMYRG